MRKNIVDVLRPGSDNGLTMRDLEIIFHCNSREIRKRVHAERIAGAVILAGNTGFYLPSEDPEKALCEIKAFERRMHAKARNTLEATKSAAAARERITAAVK